MPLFRNIIPDQQGNLYLMVRASLAHASPGYRQLRHVP
jgi:hypothetical protein